jgi:uncharacterized membrane protein YphA (DoxX/SURF4 family)
MNTNITHNLTGKVALITSDTPDANPGRMHRNSSRFSTQAMKLATHGARIMLGLIFVVFGLNAFFHFIPLPMPKGELAAEFMKALFLSQYLHAVKIIEIAGGLLLLSGRFTALGLTLVGPVVVNILFFDAFLDSAGLPLGIMLGALSSFLLWRHRASFAGLLKK